MDVHPTKNGINRYWSIAISFHGLSWLIIMFSIENYNLWLSIGEIPLGTLGCLIPRSVLARWLPHHFTGVPRQVGGQITGIEGPPFATWKKTPFLRGNFVVLWGKSYFLMGYKWATSSFFFGPLKYQYDQTISLKLCISCVHECLVVC